MPHSDFFGRELAVGDYVAYIESQGHYPCLKRGEIVKFSEKQATIRDPDYKGGLPDRLGYGLTRRYCNSIIKEI